ncbi:hypothetical protein J3369_01900 [Alteromonas sp. NFXS44]|uniref:lipopolysaccharide biosynthesis protein n=1 Tax=Alteromonas sp. NFXS44 TaxID=2818435 RepID=UPI0032DF772D
MKILKSNLTALIVKGFSAVVALMFNLVVVDTYSTSDASDAFTLVTCLLILSVFTRLGADQYIVKILARRDNSYQSTKRFTKRVNLIIIILSIGILLISLPIIEILGFNFKFIEILCFTVTLIFFSLSQVKSYIFQGKKEYVKHLYFLNLSFFLVLIMLIYLFKLLNLEYIVNNFYIIALLAAFISYLTSQTSSPIGISRRISYNSFKRTVYQVEVYFTFSLVQIILVWMPQLALYVFGNHELVASFTLMHRFSLLAGFVLISISSIYTPKFARLINLRDYVKLRKESYNFTLLATLASLVTIFTILLVIKPFMELFSDPDLLDYRVLILLLGAQLVNSMTGPSLKLLQMSEHVVRARKIQFFVFSLSIILAYPLVIYWGYLGAAVLCFLNITLANVLYFRAARKIYFK